MKAIKKTIKFAFCGIAIASIVGLGVDAAVARNVGSQGGQSSQAPLQNRSMQPSQTPRHHRGGVRLHMDFGTPVDVPPFSGFIGGVGR